MPTTDTFVERVQTEARTLERRDAELAAREEEIKRERTEIRSRLGDYGRVVSVYRELMGLARATKLDVPGLFPDEQPAVSSNGSGARPTIADISAAYMAAHGGRAKVSDLVAELVRLKRLTGKDGDYGSVFGTLKRNKRRFTKVGPGEFASASPEGTGS